MPDEAFLILPAEPLLYNPILLWGVDLVRMVQGIKSPALTALMSLASDLCIVLIVLFALVLFWCIDEKKGFRLGTLLIVSTWLNSFLKDLLKQPRPFNLDPTVGLASESSFGLPSGHSQISLVFFVFCAVLFAKAVCTAKPNETTDRRAALCREKLPRKKIVIWIAAVFFILLTAFSRIYLGVHFPTDVAGGWFTGGVLLVLFFTGERHAARLLESAGKRGQLITTALAAFLMLVVYSEDSSLSALFLGFAGGYALLHSSAPFSAKAPVDGKVPGLPVFGLRFFLGIAGTALVYSGLKMILPGGSLLKNASWWGPSSPYLELGRFIRYGLLGLWISAGAPLLFGKLNLAASCKGGRD